MLLELKCVFLKSLKRILYFTFYYSGFLHAMLFLFIFFKKHHCAAILFYHRFCEGPPSPNTLPQLDIREFQKQMAHLKRWYDVITLDEVVSKLSNKEYFSAPSVIITIDDGYASIHNLAYPVLTSLNLSATIYLTTGLIETNRGLWVDDLMDMLAATQQTQLEFSEIFGSEILDISTPRQKRSAVSMLFKVLLQLEHSKRLKAIESLKKLMAVADPSLDNQTRKMLTWDEVLQMNRNNIHFAPHTVTHPTLSKMPHNEAKKEIHNSKKDIEKRLQIQCAHFAIPNGKSDDFTDELKIYCKQSGIRTIVSTEPGLVHPSADPFFLKRIIPPPPIYYFACELARYFFFHKPKDT